MQPRHCCQGRQTDRRLMTQKRPHSASFPMAKPGNRISGFRKPSKRDKRPQLFCEGSRAQPRRRGKGEAHWITVGGRRFDTHHSNCGRWRWFLRKKTAPNARGVALRPPTSAVKRGCSPGCSRGHPGVRVPVEIRPDVGAALAASPADKPPGGRALKTE